MPEHTPPKTICIDFDGVIHSYVSGWKGADQIPDPPVEGAIEGLWRLVSDPEIDVAIYSARSGQPGGIEAMRKWLNHWDSIFRTEAVHKRNELKWVGRRLISNVRFPESKPPAICYVDDRGVPFTGDWSVITTDLKNFKPWNDRKL